MCCTFSRWFKNICNQLTYKFRRGHWLNCNSDYYQRIIICKMTVHGLPADRVWYLVLVQAYLEQGRAKVDRAWCHGVVVTKGWKARTDNKWAVYRGVRDLSIGDGVREYGIGRHKV